jgi:hypothetical protein
VGLQVPRRIFASRIQICGTSKLLCSIFTLWIHCWNILLLYQFAQLIFALLVLSAFNLQKFLQSLLPLEF